jgi:hypothetical protein
MNQNQSAAEPCNKQTSRLEFQFLFEALEQSVLRIKRIRLTPLHRIKSNHRVGSKGLKPSGNPQKDVIAGGALFTPQHKNRKWT